MNRKIIDFPLSDDIDDSNSINFHFHRILVFIQRSLQMRDSMLIECFYFLHLYLRGEFFFFFLFKYLKEPKI